MGWIEVVTRLSTWMDRDFHPEKIYKWNNTFTYDCDLPECSPSDYTKQVLVTNKYGRVEIDTFVADEEEGCYFIQNRGYDAVLAWMPLPEPYKKGE